MKSIKVISESKARPKSVNTSFHEAIKYPIILAQCFGFFPVTGVLHANYKGISFKWGTWLVGYSLLTISLLVAALGVQLYKIYNSTERLLEINSLVYEIIAIVNWTIFFWLAMKWAEISKELYEMENVLINYEHTTDLRKQFMWILSFFLATALMEHILYVVEVVNSIAQSTSDWQETMKSFFVISHIVFNVTEYALWKALILQYINLQRTFLWTFSDVFLMLLSLTLSTNLQRIKKKVQIMTDPQKEIDPIAWEHIRKKYNKLYNLKEFLNERISWMIMHSFAANMYFILAQLFRTLNPIMSFYEGIYIITSITLLISRTIFICIYSGQISTNSKEIMKVLNKVPTSSYSIEIQRLYNFIAYNNMALNGRNFFEVKKNLILKMAGAIVTYSLVLIQFHVKK